MTRQRFLTKQQCVENVIVVDALDVTRNRAVSLDCACSAEIVYCWQRQNLGHNAIFQRFFVISLRYINQLDTTSKVRYKHEIMCTGNTV